MFTPIWPQQQPLIHKKIKSSVLFDFQIWGQSFSLSKPDESDIQILFAMGEKKLHEGLEEIRLASYKSIDLADYKM